jgi:hypothetical protein
MRAAMLCAIAVGLAGCTACYPLNCPPYDPAQFGCGPRCPYTVERSYYGLPCYNPGPRPYYVVPPYAQCGNNPYAPSVFDGPVYPGPPGSQPMMQPEMAMTQPAMTQPAMTQPVMASEPMSPMPMGPMPMTPQAMVAPGPLLATPAQ